MAERILLQGSPRNLTPELLRKFLRYEPDTGYFFWKTKPSRRIMIGDHAGTSDEDGYVTIVLGGVHFAAHRLAWFYMTSRWPENEIDHRNLVPADNWWRNLREATHGENQQNQRRAKSHNASGLLGAFRVADASTYTSRIVVDGKKTYLGNFATAEAAHRAYLKAKRELHPYGEIAKA